MSATQDHLSDRILEAAADLFAARGWRSPSLDDIAARAQVGRATVYRRFGNRSGLLDALVVREANHLTVQLEQALSGIEDPPSQLVAAFVLVVRKTCSDTRSHRLLDADRHTVGPRIRTKSDVPFNLARTMVTDWLRGLGSEAGLTAPPDVLADLLIRIGHSLLFVPDTFLPLQDSHALADVARAVLVPMVFRRDG